MKQVQALTLFVGLFCVFKKLRKANVNFVLSVRIEQLGSHWTGIDEP
jgi:hypothetical protein